MNEIVQKARELYLSDMGEDGCIEDPSCECFACLLSAFAVEVDRRQERYD